MLKPSEPLLQLSNAGVERAGRWLVRGVQFAVCAGEIVTMIGPNGSGKSTLLGLMTGVLAPTKGEVLFNGVSLKDLDPAAFRRHICYLPQRAALFEGTILENLTMFRGDRYATKAMQFADRLRLHSVIAQMPNGYDTKVLRKVVSIRKQDRNERAEQEALLELYLGALGEI